MKQPKTLPIKNDADRLEKLRVSECQLTVAITEDRTEMFLRSERLALNAAKLSEIKKEIGDLTVGQFRTV